MVGATVAGGSVSGVASSSLLHPANIKAATAKVKMYFVTVFLLSLVLFGSRGLKRIGD